MKIKVCGLKYPENIAAVAALKPDYMGFIGYSLSQRYIGELDAQALNDLPETIIKTGVFVNEDAEEIFRLVDAYHFDAIQLHGNESPEFCAQFKDRIMVIRAFGLNEHFDFEQLKPYSGSVHQFLFDTKTEQHGGSGKVFDWSLMDKYKLDIPFLLSGGLSLENLESVKEIKHAQFHGVDLNSRFEVEPGLKDISKLEKAFELLK
jgi:phosphoribosylanthranilate isomerase